MMEKRPDERALPAAPEQIRLHKPVGRAGLMVFAFLICVSILIAAFAVSQVWKRGKQNRIEQPARTNEQTTESSPEQTSPEPSEPPAESAPENATAILIRTYSDVGIRNETTYVLPEGSIETGLFRDALTTETDPLVLILHTHPEQAYLTDEADHIPQPLGNSTYSTDPARNVVAVGEVLCRTLCEKGIPAVHAVEDTSSGSSLGAYAHAAELIAAWRERYPTIRLIIDVQRDAILDTEGNYIRPVAEVKDGREKIAQIMAIVGSDAEGSDYSDWEKNYALAAVLREGLNREGRILMRSISVRRSSYNQELAPYALLLEIGSGANTVEEACRAAEEVGSALAKLLL